MISIVLPTYNERENIATLISNIFDVFKKNDIAGNVIVVDDNSPDGTGEIVRNVIDVRSDGNVILINRPNKMGLGSAYIEGFKRALNIGSDYIFEMDADLSHSPGDIPRFIQAAKKNDLVIGSRYILGGKIENWNFLRKLISKGGTIYAKKILNIPIKDLTSGFKCFRREVLEKVNIDKIESDGYSFQVEMTYKSYKMGFKIKEIPIIFRDRNKGESKFSKKILLEAALVVWKLRILNQDNENQ